MLLALASSALLLAAATPPSEADVLAAETRRFAAMVSVDMTTLDALLSDDLVYTHSTGRVETKAQFLESLKAGTNKYKGVDRSDIRVRMYGDTAVVTGAAVLQVETAGNPMSLPIRYTDVYVKSATGWRMVTWQSTRIPQAQ